MKYFIGFLTFLPSILMACPYCAGNADSPDKYSFWIITVAVIIIYIPFYMIFKMAFKKRSFDMDSSDKGEA